ncbi:hypothetical protein Moror_10337 [Moniliophthora roreri MCA 2997]|uniref:Uncharacterized protein n=1 Tax=Moniliophthora roreri (strain MCA 2997) TaxID=1381753 RepID=V2WYU4_MONRO|nr:hypothetical protein Moror_10337 [Moniliophthora roreri MCA 2997]
MAVEDIVVDDSSPTIFYTPFSDTFGTIPNFPAGWNALLNFSFAGFPIQVSRNMSTVHATSRDGASLSINFQGTGIQLLGSANGAAYDILLDGSSNSLVQTDNLPAFMLASVGDLPNGNHTVSLTARARQGTPLLAFDGAVITSEVPDQGDG